MQQLTFIRKGVLEWRDAPEPKIQSAKEAIVRPFIAARCDGDNLPLFHRATRLMQLGMAVHYVDPLTRDVLGDPPLKGPFPFGHECVAEVVECGPDVRSAAPGDIVVVPWAISCGQCFNCDHGWTSKCAANDAPIAAYGFGPAMGPWGGAVSDKLRVPYADAMLVKVPAGLDPLALASASDNLPDGWRTVGPHLERFPGAPVLVLGGPARSVGLYAAGIAVALGASRVDYMDSDSERLRIAEALGAAALPIPAGAHWLRKHAPRRGGPYLISVDATASVAGLDYALRSLAPGGVCTGVGYYFARKGGLPLMQMYINSSSLHIGVSHARADLPNVLDLVAAGKLRPEIVTTVLADWEDAPKAFLEQTTKVVVKRRALNSSRVQ